MPEDIPGCLFSPAGVSAVGSVPMCPAPSTESAEQEESETFSPRECQQPEALVRKRLPSLWCTSHSPSVCETDPACVLEKSTQCPEWGQCSHMCLWTAVDIWVLLHMAQMSPTKYRETSGFYGSNLILVAILRCGLK